VLRDQPEWTRDRIRQAMLGDKTIQVTLRNPIPVLIVYGTAVAPESGEVRFLPDIYGHDDALEKLLAKRHSD
jgi:murein L,D-transpeptidase YcbB/YkuD